MQVPPEDPVTHEAIRPSGTGKTTLLTCINHLVKPTSGTIAFDDIRMDFARPDKIAVQAIRLRTAMVFQQFNVFKNMTVIPNAMDPLVVVQGKSKEEAALCLCRLEKIIADDLRPRAEARTLWRCLCPHCRVLRDADQIE
ncbi:hypothetical protein GCM10007919_02270 [Rhizobium indigoferae]|nr:hypothetical protein GCM10007919_02270 [Rhizobium indigoferae]